MRRVDRSSSVESRDDGRHGAGGHPPLRDDFLIVRADPLLRARKGRGIGFDQRHFESRIEERDRDALTHRAAADHGGALERPRRPGHHVRARPARLAFGEKGVAKRLRFRRLAQRQEIGARVRDRIGERHVDRAANRRDDLLRRGLAAAFTCRLQVALEDLRGNVG